VGGGSGSGVGREAHAPRLALGAPEGRERRRNGGQSPSFVQSRRTGMPT
jgi:hypothetical protein